MSSSEFHMKHGLWADLGALLIAGAAFLVAVSESRSQTKIQSTPDESQLSQLQTLRRDIDKDLEQNPVAKDPKFQADLLARQFSVPPSVVEDLRGKRQGWGTIAIELAMAQHLCRLDPISYRTVSEALDQVRALRTDGKGWGAISRELGFKLGPIINEMRHVRQDLQIEKERLKDQLKAERAMGITSQKVQLALEHAEKLARGDRAPASVGKTGR